MSEKIPFEPINFVALKEKADTTVDQWRIGLISKIEQVRESTDEITEEMLWGIRNEILTTCEDNNASSHGLAYIQALALAWVDNDLSKLPSAKRDRQFTNGRREDERNKRMKLLDPTNELRPRHDFTRAIRVESQERSALQNKSNVTVRKLT